MSLSVGSNVHPKSLQVLGVPQVSRRVAGGDGPAHGLQRPLRWDPCVWKRREGGAQVSDRLGEGWQGGVKVSSPTGGGAKPRCRGTRHGLVCPLSQQHPARCRGSQWEARPVAQLGCCQTLEQPREGRVTGDTPQLLPTVSCSWTCAWGPTPACPAGSVFPSPLPGVPTLLQLLQPLSAPPPQRLGLSRGPPRRLPPSCVKTCPSTSGSPRPGSRGAQGCRRLWAGAGAAVGPEGGRVLSWSVRGRAVPRAQVGRPSLCQGAREQGGRLPPRQRPLAQGSTRRSRSCLSPGCPCHSCPWTSLGTAAAPG